MSKFNSLIINQNIDEINLSTLTLNNKKLIKQSNKVIFMLYTSKEYSQEIINQWTKLINMINLALENIDRYDVNIILFTVENSLKLLNIFDQVKAQSIWNKIFINQLTKYDEPELLFDGIN